MDGSVLKKLIKRGITTAQPEKMSRMYFDIKIYAEG